MLRYFYGTMSTLIYLINGGQEYSKTKNYITEGEIIIRNLISRARLMDRSEYTPYSLVTNTTILSNAIILTQAPIRESTWGAH